MDLPYPSQKDQQFRARLSPGGRKPSLVLKDSLRNIPSLPPLEPSLKKQMLYLIRNDYPYELKEFIEKEVVSLRVEVGRDGSDENLLHVACRQNAEHCVQFLLKRYFMYFPGEYQFWVNLGNKERMTPAMLCSLTGANDSLKILLDYGGIDIHLIDSNKLSAYQIAMASKNENAVRMLMEYQGSKKAQHIEKEKLNQIIELLPGKISFCESIYRCLFDCFRGGVSDSEIDEKVKKIRSKRNGSMLDVVSGGIEGYFMDRVEFGYSKDIIRSDEVQWRTLGEYQQSGNTGVLFDTFSPFDMQDISFPMENMLIGLQSLSQHTWVVRRSIQVDKSKPSQYLVIIYPKHQLKTLSIDAYLPFLSANSQPLFIADKKEGWPMLLQKALAKHYGSYKALSSIPPSDLIQTLTGWPSIRVDITDGAQAMQFLQKITSLGYMFMLEGKDNSYLSCPQKHNCYFTVLTFYSKGDKRLVLVNCPFVDPAWVQKERHQILALKILRGHYNCRQQMTIWIEEERLKEYFSAIIIAPLKTGHHRHSLNLNALQNLYFRVEIGQTQEEPVVLYLVDSEKGKIVPIDKSQGWLGEKEPVTMLAAEKCREQMASFDARAGEYLFRVKVPKGKYQLVGWASEEIKLEAVQESFGELEWIACLKKHLSLNWNEEDHFRICNTGEYTLMMVRSEGECWASGFNHAEVIQGKKADEGIQMMPCEQFFRFCVVRGNVTSANFYEA